MVCLDKARGLESSNGLPNPYVKLFIKSQPREKCKKRSDVVQKNTNPVFAQEFSYEVSKLAGVDEESLKDDFLLVEVMSQNVLGSNEFLGKGQVPIGVGMNQNGMFELRLLPQGDDTPWAEGCLKTSTVGIAGHSMSTDSIHG